jgi:hypothetical protein
MVGFNAAQSGAIRASDAVIGNSVQSLAATTIAQNRRLGTTDIAGINAAIDKLAVTDPAAANALRREISGNLSTVEQGQLAANYGALNQGGNLLAANPGGAARGLSKAQADLITDVAQMGFDIAGIFDPTPISDGISAGISLGKGDWFGFAISAGSAIFPYVGDAAKLGKLGKWAKTISQTVDMAASNPAFRKSVEPALRQIMNAIDSVGLNRLPKEVQPQFANMRRKIDNLLNPKYIPSQTAPTGKLGGDPIGPPTPNKANADSLGKRGIMRENQSAQILADRGYKVEQNPKLSAEQMQNLGLKPGKDPDFLVEGKVFDNLAPLGDTAKKVAASIKGKVDAGQTRRIVLNLGDTPVTPGDIQRYLKANPIPNLQEIIAIDKNGGIHRSFP